MSSSLRLRLRLANATVQSAGPSDSYFWHAGHFRHFSHFSAPAEGGAHETAGGTAQGRRLNRVLGTSAPASGSAWRGSPSMLGRKAGCEGVRTDFPASLAASRHRDIGPARFKPVDCDEAHKQASQAQESIFQNGVYIWWCLATRNFPRAQQSLNSTCARVRRTPKRRANAHSRSETKGVLRCKIVRRGH